MSNRIILLIAAVLLTASCTAESSQDVPVLRLATTTSTNDSGLLDALIPSLLRRQHGLRDRRPTHRQRPGTRSRIRARMR